MNTNTEKMEVIQQIAVAKIRPDPNNRKDHDKAKIKSLAESIASTGLLQPIIVRRSLDKASGTDFIILAGERRWLAHKELKAETIAARVLDAEAPTAEKLQNTAVRAIENLQRENLTPIEEAEVYAQLAESGHSQEAIAKIANKSQPEVANTLGLLKLPPKVRELVANGSLSAAHGKTLGRFKRWPRVCELIALDAVEDEVSSRELEEQVLPCEYELKRKKLAIEINTRHYSWSDEVAYVIPTELQKDPDFLKDGETWWCFAPEKWAPHKAAQDKAHAEKKKKADKAETSRQSKMTPAEKAKRQKVISENKRMRAESVHALAEVVIHLREIKAIDVALLQVVVGSAWNHHWKVGENIEQVAKLLGIVLPKNFDETDLDQLAKLNPHDALRLTAGCIMAYEAEFAAKYAHEIPEQLAHVLGAKKIEAIKREAAEKLNAKKGGAK